MIKQRPRRLIPPGMESGSEGAADRDHIHSRWCGRGSSPFRLNLLRENPTTAVLQCAHIVEGFLFHCTCTVTPSPALKAGTTLFLHFGWMISTHGRKAAASSGVVGWQQRVPGLPGPPCPRCSVGLAAQPVLLLSPSACWHSCLRLTGTRGALAYPQLILNRHCSSPRTALLLRSCHSSSFPGKQED